MARDLRLEVILQAVDRVTRPLRTISGSSTDLGRKLKQSRDALKGLQATQADISSFRRLKAGAEQTGSALSASRDKVRQLSREMAAAENPSKKLTSEFQRAVREAQRLKASHADHQQKLQVLRSRLMGAGVSTRNLSEHERDLRGRITAANGAIQQQEALLKRVSAQQARKAKLDAAAKATHNAGMVVAGHGAGAMFLGRRGLDGLWGQAQVGIDFDSTMSQVQALTRLNKNSSELKALREQARQLGADTMFSATDAAQGQSFLAMAGFTPQAIRDAMPGTLDLAKAGGAELAETTDIASNILTGFGLKASEMGRVGDVLVGAFTRSNTNLVMLGETMKYAAPIAASLGQDIEVMAAMAGKLGDAGIQGSMGGTALRAILNRLSAPPKAAAKALDKLGISAADARGNLKPMPELLREIYDRTKNMGETQRAGLLKGIAGEEAVSALSVLVNQAGSGQLQEFISTLRQAQGEAARTAKVMGDNLVGELDELSSAWEDVRIGLFDQQEGGLRELVRDLTDVVRGIGSWVEANPALAAGIAKWVAIGAAAITVLGALAIGVGSVMMLAPAILKIAGAFKFLSMVLLLNPIGLAITLLAGAAFLLWKNWDGVIGGLQTLWQQLGGNVTAVLGNIGAAILNWSPLGLFYRAFAGVLSWFGIDLPKSLTEGFTRGLTSLWTNLVPESIKKVADSTVSWFKEKLGIHSPSRVFAELGGYTMQGLDRGLAAGARAPLHTVAGLGKQLAAAGALSLGATGAIALDNRPPLAAGGSPVVVQGDTIHITISAGAGADSAALAQQINRILDERERGKAARLRSALYDRE